MQGKKLLQGILAVFFMAIASAPAFAVMSIPNGWVAEANFGSSSLSSKSYPGTSSSSGMGMSFNAGYKFMSYVAVEAGFAKYAETSVKNSAGVKVGKDKHDSWHLAVKGIAPVYDSGFETFAKLGVARTSSEQEVSNSAAAAAIGYGATSHTDYSYFLGLGAQYYFLPELAVVGQWERADGNAHTGTSDLISVGVNFIFG